MWPSDSIVDNLERSKCLGGTTHIGILANGEVVLCCLDNIGATTFGNVKNQTLHDIIENSNFNRIVGNLKNGKCDYEICQKCTYRNRFK